MAQSFTIYKSTDTSAPTLNGASGSLVALLDAVLVNGYGSMPAAGWSRPFTSSATSGSVYKNAGIAPMYFRIDDTCQIINNEAQITGFETMTDFNTGSGAFPNFPQTATGTPAIPFISNSYAGVQAIVKINTPNSITGSRAWIVVADERTCYGMIYYTSTTLAGTCLGFGFGEFYSLVPGDRYNNFVVARAVNNNQTLTNDRLDNLSTLFAGSGFYVPRGYSQQGSSVNMSRNGDAAKAPGTQLLGSLPYPSIGDGGIYIYPIWICDFTTPPGTGAIATIRGRMRGFYQWGHLSAAVNNLDTLFCGNGIQSGKSFLLIKGSGNNSGIYTIETSPTLEFNI